MRNLSRLATLILPVLGCGIPTAASAQDYPTKPIRFIVGPGPDVLARLLGQKLTESWGQQVVVDQRPAVGGMLAADAVAKAAADGHTLLLSTPTYTTLMSLYPKVPYDFVKDLAPVSLLASIPFLLAVHPSVPARSTQELIRLARARPGQLNYASSGVGATSHLAHELLNNMAGIKTVHVPYKGTGPGLIDLIAGQVQMALGIMQGTLPYAKAGKIRALAVSSLKRSASAPELPTIDESGVPGYEFTSWNGVHVTAGTSAAVIMKLNAELLRILALPDVKDRMFDIGLEQVGSTPEELAALVNANIDKWGKLIRALGVRGD
jgi:tripartite-type tricarboxylate transporter receptor subunit TctC